MSKTIIREITGIKSIKALIEHFNKVKDLFEDDPIEITVEHIDKDSATIYVKRVRNNE